MGGHKHYRHYSETQAVEVHVGQKLELLGQRIHSRSAVYTVLYCNLWSYSEFHCDLSPPPLTSIYFETVSPTALVVFRIIQKTE